MSNYTENTQIEQPAIELFELLKWQTINAYDEALGEDGTLGRESQQEVVLLPALWKKLNELNPDIPEEQLQEAVTELTKDRSSMHPVKVNKEVYDYLREGIDVAYHDKSGKTVEKTVRFINWREPEKNDYQLVSQFWVSGDLGRKRPDLVGFINGIPILLFELKKAGRRVYDAFRDNLSDYKDTIPQLFWYNQIVILSNGVDTKVGSFTSEWEHFSEWKRISDEDEPGVISLQTVIAGICEPNRMLDIIENFVLFKDIGLGDPKKLLARNHQFLGVNEAIDKVRHIRQNKGRLGVFWHTQGSGKSFSMAMFTRKILRNIRGDWKFVIVTDRIDLDDQIYKNFASVGAVTEPENEIRAGNKEQLKQLLSENHRYIFTLIHKFHNRDEKTFPVISEDSDIIVITDEAHRTQYDTLAMNMRKALPNAAFIGFTGTPLIKGGSQKTKEVFGDYVSVYDFRQSIEDGATVPLYYENRIPEVELINDDLNDDISEVLDEAMLNEKQEEKLEREFRQEYHLITRDDRLDTVAKDIVSHFANRGYLGKGMVISVDRYTAVKMYDKVQQYWQQEIERLKKELETAKPPLRDVLLEKLGFMTDTDMAVVISQSQNEVKDFDERGVDIRPHRKRIVKEALDEKFKDSADPLRLVFVCAMWITGFDVPSLSTLYLDKPMKNHTLMQTIARANRVFEDKNNGMIVDYIGVFLNLKKALAIYGTGGKGDDNGSMPIKKKGELIAELEKAVAGALAFCKERGIDLDTIIKSKGFDIAKYQDEFAKTIVDFDEMAANVEDSTEKILMNEQYKLQFAAHVNLVNRLYKAIMPDPAGERFLSVRSALKAILDRIKVLGPLQVDDINDVRGKVEDVLDVSVASKNYTIDNGSKYQTIDLSKVDFDKLKEKFNKSSHKHIAIEQLKTSIEDKLEQMIAVNRTRMDFKERFEEMIDQYNTYSVNVQELFDELIGFVEEINEEEHRHYKENLSEEQLAIYDLVTQMDQVKLSEKDKKTIKKGVRDLLESLKKGKFVLDWKKHQKSRAGVKVTIESGLDKVLPDVYDRKRFSQACNRVYDHVMQVY